MPHPKVKISDDSGNTVGVTSNRLDVNAHLAATPTIDIGDVSLLLGGTAASVNNGAADATTLRVTIASDTTGVLSVDDNGSTLSIDDGGGAITVDGTVTANLSATDNAVLDNILVDTSAIKTAVQILDDWDDSNYANVNLNLAGSDADTGAGVYGAQTLRVTLAADDLLTTLMVADLDTIAADTTGIAARFLPQGQSFAQQRGIPAFAQRKDTLGEDFSGYAIADGDWYHLQLNSKGALYITGSEIENSAVQSDPLLIGGRYDSSARTLGDGDAGAVALNASGHILVDVVDGGQLDTIIDTLETTLTAIETDQAAIETLLTGIDSDTDAIKTATELIDDAVADEGAALGKGILMQGDDGTDRRNLQVQASSGALKVSLDTSGPIGTVGGSSGGFVMQMGVDAKDFDGSALPDSTGSLVEGDLTYPAASTQGVLYNMPVNQDGSKSPIDQTSGQMITTHGVTGGADGVTTDDTSGTALAGDVPCKKVDIQAQTDNTGLIAVGFTGVDATEATGTGIILYAGDTYSLEINNLQVIFIEATVSGEGVRYTYFT